MQELSSADMFVADVPTWNSLDLCRLYLVSTRLGPAHVFVAERQPK